MAIEHIALSKPNRILLMLSALVAVFMLSHAFRTVVAIIAEPLTTDFNASAQWLGIVAGAFNIAFALAQPVVGVALDRYGPRRTVLVAFILTLIGSAVSAFANGLPMLIVGQWLIGCGCAPALLAAMVFISRNYPADRFASMSGIVLAVGGLGMLITGTPLAWVVEQGSWRVGFMALGLLAAGAWLAVLCLVKEQTAAQSTSSKTLGAAMRDLLVIFRQPHTVGICCLAAVTYAAAMALRGLWLGPILSDRYDFSLIEIGHVASAIPLALLFGPVVFGRLDAGGYERRQFIIICSIIYAMLFAVIALGANATLDVTLAVFSGFFSGFIVLQYADARSAYAPEFTGRALSVFTMAMFGGVAAMQWLSGVAATYAAGQGDDPLRAAMLTVAAVVVMGIIAFWILPWPPKQPATANKAGV